MGTRHNIAVELSAQNLVPSVLEGRKVLRVVFEEIAKELERHGRAEIRNFGIFEVRTYPAKTVFLKGKARSVPSRRRVNFRIGNRIRDRLNRTKERSILYDGSSVLRSGGGNICRGWFVREDDSIDLDHPISLDMSEAFPAETGRVAIVEGRRFRVTAYGTGFSAYVKNRNKFPENMIPSGIMIGEEIKP